MKSVNEEEELLVPSYKPETPTPVVPVDDIEEELIRKSPDFGLGEEVGSNDFYIAS